MLQYCTNMLFKASWIVLVCCVSGCDNQAQSISSWCSDHELALPDEGILQGIDVSHYQGKVDWHAVRSSGVYFAFAKATQGDRHVDPTFHTHWQAMNVSGVVRGAYHFFKPEIDALSQAKHFVATVKLEVGDLPPVLDIELDDGVTIANLDRDILIWLEHVSKAYGVRPIIYSDPGFITKYLSEGFEDYPLWLARYSHRVPEAPTEWKAWNFWQCTQNGKVSGIEKAVDKSIYQGSKSHWRSLLGAFEKS